MGTDFAMPVPPWLDNARVALAERMASDRLPHAILLHGPAGTGKGLLARQLAALMLCRESRTSMPCGHCQDCNLFLAGSHPDLFLATPAFGQLLHEDESLRPRKDRKPTQPPRQIRIDCIRELIRFSSQSAHQGGRRVVIVEPAEWLNHHAANALLKTLEEPGEELFLLLVSHQPSRLMPTLRSRCQAIACPAPHHPQALEWLRHHTDIDRAELALSFSQGAPLKALSAIRQDHDLLYREVMLTLEACRERQVSYLFAAESLAGHDAGLVLEWWLSLVHRLSCSAALPSLFAFHDRLIAARRQVDSTANPNPRLLFESLLAEWITLRAA